MSKVYLTLPQSELLKFQQWTKTLTTENQNKCERLVRSTCFNIVRRAMRFSPVNFGFLKSSIGTDANSKRMSGAIWAGGIGKGVNVRYAPYVEFGTGSGVSVPPELQEYALQFKGRGLRKVNRRAQPYFFPSVNLGMKEMLMELNKMGFK